MHSADINRCITAKNFVQNNSNVRVTSRLSCRLVHCTCNSVIYHVNVFFFNFRSSTDLGKNFYGCMHFRSQPFSRFAPKRLHLPLSRKKSYLLSIVRAICIVHNKFFDNFSFQKKIVKWLLKALMPVVQVFILSLSMLSDYSCSPLHCSAWIVQLSLALITLYSYNLQIINMSCVKASKLKSMKTNGIQF